jgi:murein L,D-transpeptidase YcbB/YkuD
VSKLLLLRSEDENMKHSVKDGKTAKALDRRLFLRGAAGLGLAALSVPAATSAAFAQAVGLNDVLSSGRRGNWSDTFDARGTGGAKAIATNQPIMSPQTLNYISAAINQYNMIVANGGWPTVQGNERLRLGMKSQVVPILRQRLMISGDLPEGSGSATSFET